MTNSAVLPMKNRFRPERDTTPMATIALRSRLAARGIAFVGPALHEMAVAALHVETIDRPFELATCASAFELIACRRHVDHRAVGHRRHDRDARLENMQRVQFAMQRVHELRTRSQDLPVEIARLGKGV